MKRIIEILLIVPMAASAVTIPLASPRQIMASPLMRGEIADIERGNYAELYVGGEHGPLRVTDGSALRGFKTRVLEPSEYSVSAGPLWTYNPANGTYKMTTQNATNSIIIMTKNGVEIDGVSIEREFVGEGLMPGEFTYIESTYDKNVYRWEVAWNNANYLLVTKITVRSRDIGEIDWINDAGTTTFKIRDALGLYDLFDLRKWARDLYNGNRGENWSGYPAYSSIRLDGNPIRFTEDNKFVTMISDDTNLVLVANRHTAIEVNTKTNAAIEYTTFAITEIDVGNATPGTPVVLDFTTDITGFTTNNLGVETCNALEDHIWMKLVESDFVISDVAYDDGFWTGTITIPNGIQGYGNGRTIKNRRFFRLIYGAATSDVIDIVLHGRIVVEDIIVIKGTDGKYYRIDINGGSMSATEVSL